MAVECKKCTENCTALGNVLYKTEISYNLSKIEKSDTCFNFNTKSTSPSIGNIPNKSEMINHCYMTEEVHVNSIKIPRTRNFPVTIMVADTIGTIKSR